MAARRPKLSMPDNLKKTGRQDDERINVSQPHEVDYRSRRLGVTEAELRRAVSVVGPMVASVRRFLGR